MNKEDIIGILEEIAELLELQSENHFKVRAYRNAARSLMSLSQDIQTAAKSGMLSDLPGIGESLSEKISTLALKGRLPYYEQLKKATPKGLVKLMQIQGLGPKKIRMLYQELKIQSIAALRKAAEQGKVSRLKGFGVKTEKNILETLKRYQANQTRHLWWNAMQMAEPILQQLKQLKGVKKAEIAGSLRRRLETVGDLDFLVGTNEPRFVTQWLTNQPFVEKILAQGDTKCSILSKGGIQIDLRIVPVKQFAFALCYFTGSKEHNIQIRERALKKGWSLGEYGIEITKAGERLPYSASKPPSTEEGVYRLLDLPYIPPELREDMGEIEAAAAGRLPHLIEEGDLRGSLHNHTAYTDGHNSLHEMVAAADKLGWDYIGISDHSKSDFQANGLNEKRLFSLIEEIRQINASKKYRSYIFAGLECNILASGELDFTEKVLKHLDYVIVSVHSSLQQDERTLTRRLIRAIEHPCATIVGHLTGRILLQRDSYHVNISKVIDACVANHKIIEINGNPMRMDMDWRHWHAASQKGLLCCINADAHAINQLEFVRSGINVARKGWLEKKNVINTMPLGKMKKFLRDT
jgi:DNA polymerase (family 10)